MDKEEFLKELKKLKDEVLHDQIKYQIDGMYWICRHLPVDFMAMGYEQALARIRKEFEIYTPKNLVNRQEFKPIEKENSVIVAQEELTIKKTPEEEEQDGKEEP